MGIVDEDVARVRDATDFLALAGEYLALKRVGRQWQALCPFHAERSPSFSINPELGVYYCFGCQASGDVITFIREIDHLDFAEAVERLAGRAGITLRYDNDTADAGRERQRRNRLFEAMEQAVEWYHERLLKAPDAAAARGYLRSRGYDGDVVRQFKLGWAPDAWDELARALRLPDGVLTDTGLGFLNRRNRQQDAFRGRVMFPIFDPGGRPVAFGGRILPGGDGPKYKNSQETPIYSKRRVLYGLNWAKQAVVDADEVVVCEGYTDVIGFFLAGVPRAVATCGTALADEHVRLLKKFAPRVVLAYDADSAGQAAADRVYAWEQKEQIDFAVAAFPPGADPADLARSEPGALANAVREARPFLAFRVERVLAAADLRTAEGRARAAASAMAAVAEHPNELVRDQYLREIADRCRIDPDQLRSLAARGAAGSHGGRRLGESGGRDAVEARPRPNTTETELLRLAVHAPDLVAGRLDDVSGGADLERVAALLFSDDLHLAAFRALAAADTMHEAVAKADPGAAELLRQLAVEDSTVDVDDVVALLVRAAAVRTLRRVEAEARSQPERAADLAPVNGWLKVGIEELAPDHHDRLGAASRLVPWLLERGEEVG